LAVYFQRREGTAIRQTESLELAGTDDAPNPGGGTRSGTVLNMSLSRPSELHEREGNGLARGPDLEALT